MRLALANPYYLPHQGGIESRIEGLARGLARRHEVAVLTARLPGTASEERRDGYTVLRCPARVLRWFPYNPPPLWTRGLDAALEAWGPDVVDFHYRWAPEWTRAMARWARGHALVFTWHNHFGEGEGPARLLSAAADARFLRSLAHARRIVCVSRAVEAELAGRGLPRARLVTVYPGFEHPPPVREPEGEHAVFVGRLVATKGLATLLDALAMAPRVRVVVAGKGPQRRWLEARARWLGLQGRVRFAGFVPEEEKIRLVASARFLVHPARWESLGHAVVEAMLLGKPVVATRAGGLPEAVGYGGLLVEPGDARALAEAMSKLWDDEGYRAKLGEAARAHAESFTWERCLAATERVYSDALEGQGRS